MDGALVLGSLNTTQASSSMVPKSYELYLLISFPWPLSIEVLTLPVITVIAFILVLRLPECLIHRLGPEGVGSPMHSTNM